MNEVQHPPADPKERELELLRAETRLLRVRLDDLNGVILELEAQGMRLESDDHRVLPSDEVKELEQARGDIRWVTRRLNKTPLAWLLRRRPGYRNLEDRWLT